MTNKKDDEKVISILTEEQQRDHTINEANKAIEWIINQLKETGRPFSRKDLREWRWHFSGLALQALLANPSRTKTEIQDIQEEDASFPFQAVSYANELIQELLDEEQSIDESLKRRNA